MPTRRGGPWDDDASAATPPGSTQVLQERSTAVMPPVVPGVAGPWADAWAARPSVPRRGALAKPASHLGWEDEPEPWPGAAGVGYYDRRYGARQLDRQPAEATPTSCLPTTTGAQERPTTRSTTSLARATRASACRCARGCSGRQGWHGSERSPAWPGVALVVLLGWSVIARAADLSFTSLVLRRYERGRRRSDVAMAVLMSPWHVVVGVVATVVSMILPLGVALAGIYGAALLLAGTRGGDLGPGAPVTLVVGGVLGLAMLWWGPGGASLRRGSRSIVRRVVPAGLPVQVLTAALAVVGVVAGARRALQGCGAHVESLRGQPVRRLSGARGATVAASTGRHTLMGHAQARHSRLPEW